MDDMKISAAQRNELVRHRRVCEHVGRLALLKGGAYAESVIKAALFLMDGRQQEDIDKKADDA